MSTEIVIIGGGVMGAATAWHLLEADPGLSVVIVEPDPSHRQAASSTASGGVRQLFTRPENILMSQYTHEIIAGWADWTAPDGTATAADTVDLGFKAQGYLFITDPARSDQLRRDYELQRGLGVESLWLEPEQLAERYPDIYTGDLGPAILSYRDGWLDPHAFLRGMLARARHLGAEHVIDTVVGFETGGNRVTEVVLASGRRLTAEHVVNVAGVWGSGLSAQLGLTLPVEPMRRYDHYVVTATDFSNYPFIKDPSGLAVRPEGDGLTAARVDFDTPAAAPVAGGGFDLSIDPAYFEDEVWPRLVDRVPSADQLRLESTWSGHYDQNRLDGNMILDRWTGHLDNFYVATGFSGHGLMHAPAVGRALTELIRHGEFQTIDLHRMGLARVAAGEPYRELTVR